MLALTIPSGLMLIAFLVASRNRKGLVDWGVYVKLMVSVFAK